MEKNVENIYPFHVVTNEKGSFLAVGNFKVCDEGQFTKEELINYASGLGQLVLNTIIIVDNLKNEKTLKNENN